MWRSALTRMYHALLCRDYRTGHPMRHFNFITSVVHTASTLSVDAQTTTATAPPRVSYLQPPHAAANHDTSLPIEELQPEDPGRKSDHTLIDSKQSTDPTRRPPRAFPQKNSKAWTGPLHSNNHIKKPFLRPTEECSHSTHTGHRVDASHFHSPLRLHSSQVISESYSCLPNSRRQPTA